MCADIQPFLSRKLVANCAINPLSALLGVPNGQLLEEADTRERLERVAREAAAVARALGIELGQDGARIATEVARRTAGNRSSMLQDLERGVPTEVDVIDGAVVERGRRCGVATPLHARVVELIHAAERGERAPSPEGLRELAALT